MALGIITSLVCVESLRRGVVKDASSVSEELPHLYPITIDIHRRSSSNRVKSILA